MYASYAIFKDPRIAHPNMEECQLSDCRYYLQCTDGCTYRQRDPEIIKSLPKRLCYEPQKRQKRE